MRNDPKTLFMTLYKTHTSEITRRGPLLALLSCNLHHTAFVRRVAAVVSRRAAEERSFDARARPPERLHTAAWGVRLEKTDGRGETLASFQSGIISSITTRPLTMTHALLMTLALLPLGTVAQNSGKPAGAPTTATTSPAPTATPKPSLVAAEMINARCRRATSRRAAARERLERNLSRGGRVTTRSPPFPSPPSPFPSFPPPPARHPPS